MMLLLLTILLILLSLLTLAGFLARIWWLFDITAHFRVQYALLLTALALCFLIAGELLLCGAAGVAAAINAARILPLYFRRRECRCEKEKPSIRLLSANIEKTNDGRKRVARLVRDVDPDIVVLAEIDEDWVAAMGRLLPEYVFVVFGMAGARGFGIAMFSRLPLEQSRTIDTGQIGSPAVIGECRLNGIAVTVIGAHPVPPINARWFRARNRYLNELAAIVRRSGGEAVVIGDLNTTPWASSFRSFCRDAGLHDSHPGFGIQATWPSRLLPLRIPIDHCLTSSGLCTLRRRVERHVGSDHLPIVVEVEVSG